MRPPKEQLDNIQLRNKGALVETDQTVLSHSLYRQPVHSRPHWLDFHQSAGFVADSFIGPVLILQAARVNVYLNTNTKTFLKMSKICILQCPFSTQCPGALISSQLPSLKGFTEGFDAPSTHSNPSAQRPPHVFTIQMTSE